MFQRTLSLLAMAALMTPACSGPQTNQDVEPPPADESLEHHAGEHAEHHKGPIHQHFGDAESFVARFEAPDRHAWQKPAEVIALMGIEPGMTVADIGAGTGYFLPHLSAAVGPEGRVLALDIEPGMVEYMQARVEREGLTNVEVRHVAFDDPGLAPGEVDRALVVNTWHHIPNRATYAAHVLSGLSPSGALFVVDYTLEAEHGPPMEIRLPPATVLEELAGVMQGVVLEETLPRQYIVKLKRP